MPDANANVADTNRITSIPMIVGSNGHDGRALSGRARTTLRTTPIKKVTMADGCLSMARQL